MFGPGKQKGAVNLRRGDIYKPNFDRCIVLTPHTAVGVSNIRLTSAMIPRLPMPRLGRVFCKRCNYCMLEYVKCIEYSTLVIRIVFLIKNM